MASGKGPAGSATETARGNDGTVSIAARLEAIRSKTRASEERMDAVLQSIEEVRSEVKDHVAETQRDLAEHVRIAERKSEEIEAKLLDVQQGEDGLHSQVSTAVDSMKTWLDRHMQELGRELSGRLESMQQSEQEVEGRVKCFESIGDRLKAMISATESVGPQLRELLGAVDDMRTNLGVSVDTIGTVRDDVQGSIAALTKAQADLGERLTRLETGLSEARAELAAWAGRLSKEQENALQSALAPIDRRATEARQLSVLAPGDFPYFRFEDLHRGSAEAVKDLIRPLVRNFIRCQRVVDLGCGRGEFLDLCMQEGIGAYGVDSNEDMVLHCQRIGLDVVRDDIVDHLRVLKEKSVDGVFCSQVVEHLPMLKVQALLRECFRVLKVGTHMVLVTINPLSLYALANNFYLDPTHVRPLPPETMRFLAEDAGFRKLSVSYFSPFGPDYTLLPVRFEQESEEQRAIRVNFDRLNHVVFGNQEYALIGLK